VNSGAVIGDEDNFNSSSVLDRRGIRQNANSSIRVLSQKNGMGPTTKSQVNFKKSYNNDLTRDSYQTSTLDYRNNHKLMPGNRLASAANRVASSSSLRKRTSNSRFHISSNGTTRRQSAAPKDAKSMQILEENINWDVPIINEPNYEDNKVHYKSVKQKIISEMGSAESISYKGHSKIQAGRNIHNSK